MSFDTAPERRRARRAASTRGNCRAAEAFLWRDREVVAAPVAAMPVGLTDWRQPMLFVFWLSIPLAMCEMWLGAAELAAIKTQRPPQVGDRDQP